MRIAIAASRKIEVSHLISVAIEEIVDGLRPGDTVLLRSRDGRSSSSVFEALVHMFASLRGVNVEFVIPDEPNRAATYRRDYELALGADEVLAYFPAGADLDGGTWHVVHAAMQKGVPCRAFTIAHDGRTELVGSEDGEPALDYAFV